MQCISVISTPLNPSTCISHCHGEASLTFSLKLRFISCVQVFCQHVCLCTGGLQIPRTEVTDTCEVPCGCWESNLGPLEEQTMIFSCWAISPVSPQLHLKIYFYLYECLLYVCYVYTSCAYSVLIDQNKGIKSLGTELGGVVSCMM